MKNRKTPDTPEAAYKRYLNAKSKLGWYLASLAIVILAMAYISAQGIRHELVRRSPDTQTITATATTTKHTCNKFGCYYASYGHYTINGHYEDDVLLGDFAYPNTGEIGVRVNPSQPRFTMNLYQASYVPQIVGPAAFGGFFFLWGLLIVYLFRKRGQRVRQNLPAIGAPQAK